MEFHVFAESAQNGKGLSYTFKTTMCRIIMWFDFNIIIQMA